MEEIYATAGFVEAEDAPQHVDDLSVVAAIVADTMTALDTLNENVRVNDPSAIDLDDSVHEPDVDGDTSSSDEEEGMGAAADDSDTRVVNAAVDLADAASSDSDASSPAGASAATTGAAPAAAMDDDDDDTGVPVAAVVMSTNEVAASRVSVPPLDVLAAPAGADIAIVGSIMHVARGSLMDALAFLTEQQEGAKRARQARGRDATADAVADSGKPHILTLVARAAPGSRPLNEGSVVCLHDRRVVGKVEEIFGPVASPWYLLRVRARDVVPDDEIAAHVVAATAAHDNVQHGEVAASTGLSALMADYASDDEVAAPVAQTVAPVAAPVDAPAAAQQPIETLIRVADLTPDTALFAVSTLCKYIFPESIRAAAAKGSDASNVYDEEVGADEAEYSDDEAEASARAAARAAERPKKPFHVDMHAAAAASSSGSGGERQLAGTKRRQRQGYDAPPAAAHSHHGAHAAGQQQQQQHAGMMAFPAPPPPPMLPPGATPAMQQAAWVAYQMQMQVHMQQMAAAWHASIGRPADGQQAFPMMPMFPQLPRPPQ